MFSHLTNKRNKLWKTTFLLKEMKSWLWKLSNRTSRDLRHTTISTSYISSRLLGWAGSARKITQILKNLRNQKSLRIHGRPSRFCYATSCWNMVEIRQQLKKISRSLTTFSWTSCAASALTTKSQGERMMSRAICKVPYSSQLRKPTRSPTLRKLHRTIRHQPKNRITLN